MDRLIMSSTSAEALRAELHRHDLMREASQSRRALEGRTSGAAAGPVAGARAAIVRRVRSAFAGLMGPRQTECGETL
jgi:hypothetical protein